ncbi:uncharacterized protein BX663DRAFT_530474 [Cokeromyces recurvatus]|uniref:uncharacterized protein n=1 Tax=Cokeromyces recurvatus TaxID=90255 RepID=UPI00221EDC69|nr:uncharacterized protein BX663DRAFT_530474 [Cokeromyces recurvatus]KAI7904435.1 hypothetical protein BX663DRAFT_530474 [Cokeromyces recurvatus]
MQGDTDAKNGTKEELNGDRMLDEIQKKNCYFFFVKTFYLQGFDRLFATRFYTQIVRPQLKYSLAISLLSAKDMQQLEPCQNICIRRIFGGSSRSSVKVILHMINQPSMKVRVSVLQAQLCAASSIPLDQRSFRKHRQEFLEESFQKLREGTRSVLLSACRPNLIIDPILWLPMTHSERSRTIRWRLGWLPRGIPKACPYHPHYQNFQDISAWLYRWPVMCTISQEMDYLIHDKLPPPPLLDPGKKLLDWLSL